MDGVVIGDNCSDAPAAVARAAGVRCLVRTAPAQPGKPRALAWGLSQVPLPDYDGVVIVDADTEVDRDFAAQLAAAGPLPHRALQPNNGVLNPRANAPTRLAAVLSAPDHEPASAPETL